MTPRRNRSLSCLLALALLSACERSALTIEAPNEAIVADGVSTATLRIVLTTSDHAPIVGQKVSILVSGNKNDLSRDIGFTDSHGEFVATLASTSAETKDITVTSAALSAATQVTFTRGPVDASHSRLSVTPHSLDADGLTAARIELVAVDAFDNIARSASVSISVSGTGAVLANATGLTSDAGAFVSSLTSSVADEFMVAATVEGTVFTQRVTFVSVPLAPQSTVVLDHSPVAADGVSTASVSVRLRGSANQPVAGKRVSVTSGAARVVPAFAITDASGAASFTVSAESPMSNRVVAQVDGAPLEQQPWLLFVPRLRVGGSLRGLSASGLVLTSPGLGEVAVDASASTFQFAGQALQGQPYAVTIQSQPNGQSCGVFAGGGVLTKDVDTVVIVCHRPWKSLSSGLEHVLAVTEDGDLWSWGHNDWGQLGTGSTTPEPIPVRVGRGFRAVSAGLVHSLALKSDGTLWGWGNNDFGQLGTGNTEQHNAPVEIGSGYSTISAGAIVSAALRSDGTLWSWGDRTQLAPVLVGSGFSAVSAGGQHFLALKPDGSVWAWGRGGKALGTGNDDPQAAPVQVAEGFSSISAGPSSSFALKPNGTLWSWGYNLNGGLGTGDLSDRPTPVEVGAGFSTVNGSNIPSLALKADGSLWAWGGKVQPNTPTQIATGVALYASGAEFIYTQHTDGTDWAMGVNQYGQLGVDTASQDFSPRRLANTFSTVITNAGANSSFAMKADGTLWAWGDNGFGQLGVTAGEPLMPLPVATGYATVAVGDNYAFGVMPTGVTWAWGNTQDGRLGTDPRAPLPRPILALAFERLSAGSGHTLALMNDETLWAWGNNSAGQLGVATGASFPVKVADGFVQVCAGANHSLGLKREGALYAWGDNSSGQLGIDSMVNQSSPTRVGDDYAQLSAGRAFSLALKTDGSLWAWGDNSHGQLGLGSTEKSLTPVRVGTRTYVAIGAGAWFSLALEADGSLWAWGSNEYGQLGLGHRVEQHSPALVGFGYRAISAGYGHVLATSVTGDLMVWGDNRFLQLGLEPPSTQVWRVSW